jgi:hypothetical protein
MGKSIYLIFPNYYTGGNSMVVNPIQSNLAGLHYNYGGVNETKGMAEIELWSLFQSASGR